MLPKQVNITMCAQKPLDNGKSPGKLKQLKQMEDTDDIKSQSTKKGSNLSTQESLPKNKNQTSSDKLPILNENIQISKLSAILEADLISRDKVSEEYWSNYSKEISKKLWCLPLIDLAGLEPRTSLSGSLNNLEENLQYSITNTTRTLRKNCPRTYWKLLQSSPQDTTEDVNITRKIRIYPNTKQKELFKKCFGAHNYFYNKAIESLKKSPKNNIEEFRKEFIPRNTTLTDENKWMKEIPIDTREEAARKAKAAQKTGFTQLKRGVVKKFELKFRSRKHSKNEIFYVAKMALVNGRIFAKKLRKQYAQLRVKRKDKELLNKNDGIFSIIKEKDNRYYICLSIKQKVKKLQPKNNICALDPGVRTFQTMYSQVSSIEFGYDTSKKLYNLYRREDKLKSTLTKKIHHKKRIELKKRCALLRTKVKHIVNDLHWKTCDRLTKHVQTILLPIFNTKQMANKNKRKISKTSTRLLLGLSHYEFQQKLLFKAKTRGRNVILCKEHYTTKTCGKCGVLNQKIGSKKIFQCEHCGLVMDRDIHAARNILIRALSIYMDKTLGCDATR